jgi:hypothetical protein
LIVTVRAANPQFNDAKVGFFVHWGLCSVRGSYFTGVTEG